MRSRISNKSLTVTSLCLVLAAATAARALTVFRVATGKDDEEFPSVSGNTVVWQFYNSRYDDWDIAGADISNTATPADFTISDIAGADFYPVIDGNDVVWQHHYRENSDGDVYGARIANGRRTSLYAVSATMDEERLPSVSDGVVVWQHKFSDVPDWDILGARLTGKDNPEPFYVSANIDVDELFPCISGSLVVWQQRSPDLPQPFVYGADISDPNRPRVFYTTMALGENEIPSLSKGWLVARETDGVGKVVVDNLFDPFNPEGISSSGRTGNPRIHKHIVVWQDQSNNTWDIRAYNLSTRQEIVVTNMKMSNQVNPAVYVDTERQRAIIVWQDDRDGNWDIYAAILDGAEVATEKEQ
jgi:beta propeller repeat protein